MDGSIQQCKTLKSMIVTPSLSGCFFFLIDFKHKSASKHNGLARSLCQTSIHLDFLSSLTEVRDGVTANDKPTFTCTQLLPPARVVPTALTLYLRHAPQQHESLNSTVHLTANMGGHAFKSLHCPRIPPDVYGRVKHIATIALRTVFTHVTVPFEIPGKVDYGDVDFLVSAPFGNSTKLTLDTFPFQPAIEAIKRALNTTHGREGFLTPTCMYFAIPLPLDVSTVCIDKEKEGEEEEEEQKCWVQIDVKICFKPEIFSWMTFELSFASQLSILGSMVKPLGLTLDREGLHIRVEEIEATDWARSMVCVTNDHWLVCRVLGLGRKVVDGGFENDEESE